MTNADLHNLRKDITLLRLLALDVERGAIREPSADNNLRDILQTKVDLYVGFLIELRMSELTKGTND